MSRRLFSRPGFPAAAVALGVAALASLLAWRTHSHHLGAVGEIGRGTAAALVLTIACGDALARWLLDAEWGILRAAFALPLGAIVSGLTLLVLGVLHVPLGVSLWLVLAAGLVSAGIARRRPIPVDRRARVGPAVALSWLAVLVILFAVALLPAFRTGADTIYGQNPDAHQVAGVAVLFQHDPPTATDPRLPVDVVPGAWRFRYPIFYPLAATSSLAHLDPIRVFPDLSALLVVMAAFGFGALATGALRAPLAAGPLASAAVGLSVLTLHLAWHPYWNQLWCLAMLPFTLLFGWRAAEEGRRRDWILFGFFTLMLAVAYPLGLPDPLLVLVALLLAHRRRPRIPRPSSRRGWLALGMAALLLSPAVLGAVVKLAQGLGQFVSTHGTLWGGDVKGFLPLGRFAGLGGGLLPALAVLGVALIGLRTLPRRVAVGMAGAVALLLLVDLRFRLSRSGAYMDFKQLSFVGPIVLTLAVSAVAELARARRLVPALAGAALAGAWVVAAFLQDRHEVSSTDVQVTAEMFQIRDWARRIPPGASVRVDVPPSGVQLWAVYMLGAHPVDTPHPVITDTYAHAAFGRRADYSLALATVPARDQAAQRPIPPQDFARDPPLFQNRQFALRRVVWPARLRQMRDTSSRTLVQP